MSDTLTASQVSALRAAITRRFGASVLPFVITSEGHTHTIRDDESGSWVRARFLATGRLFVVSQHDAAQAARIEVKRAEIASEADASAVEMFTLIDRPSLVFRTVRHYMAAERIPSVEGVTLDGAQLTAARVADVVFRSGPNVATAEAATTEALPVVVVRERDGSILRAMMGRRCLASATLRRPYAEGPLWTMTRSDGTPAGSHNTSVGIRAALRKVAREYLAEMAAPAIEAAASHPVADHVRKVVRKLPRKPAMVPQKVQQQQGRDVRRGMARCDAPGLWQIGIYEVSRLKSGMWRIVATGPGTMGDGSPRLCPSLAGAYLAATGEEMPGQEGKCVRMVPQPVQQQQARAGQPGGYRRVLPRDLFNEASLLKCLGALWIALDDTRDHGAIITPEDVGDFDICQSEADGSLFVRNVSLYAGSRRFTLSRPLNSRAAWPLYAMDNDDADADPVAVFMPEGGLSADFLALIGAPVPGSK